MIGASPPVSRPAGRSEVAAPSDAQRASESIHQPATEGTSWADACLAARIMALDPGGSGAVLRAPPGPVRDAWMAMLTGLVPAGTPLRRMPSHATDERLLGGLDLAVTLATGQRVAQRGLLAEADGGLLVVAMAERLGSEAAGRVVQALDTRTIVVERDGLALRHPARFGLLALDEGIGPDEHAPDALRERAAFWLDLSDVVIPRQRASTPEADASPTSAVSLNAATRPAAEAMTRIAVCDETVSALCEVAFALGVASLRPVLFALSAARALAALEGRDSVSDQDAAIAARLVLAPRATMAPSADRPDSLPDSPSEHGPDGREEPAPPSMPPSDTGEPMDESQDTAGANDMPGQSAQLMEVVLDACRSALPAGLLADLKLSVMSRRAEVGQAGQLQRSMQRATLRGRPAGVRIGEPRSGGRLHVLETIRAAIPRQRLRPPASQRLASQGVASQGVVSQGVASQGLASQGLAIRREDFRLIRTSHRTQATTIFLVDASGSTALHRLGEAKGAVELLLGDCYLRRDQVALLSFRGDRADLLLPPTGALARAKRCLAALPGGGGTPLATGLDAARALAEAVRQRGQTPNVIILTDGRANVARDGTPGRARAEADALAAARLLRGAGIATLLVDTSPRPSPAGRLLAAQMGARCLALPHADAATLSMAVRQAGLR